MEKEMKDETLPPGFRFHPTDEELITCYLINKISDANFTARAVTDVDLNKCEPWELPGKAKMGEKEWYFFSLRDRKYPTGVRTNRATNTGYWKTTGKDKEIFNSVSSELIGMKKTLVFYRGRAPRGEKTNWVMHEYRLHSKSSFRTTKDEWVVCRVFQKSAGAKKYPSSSNQSRSVNPYNLDMLAANNTMQSSQVLQSSDQNIAFQHQFAMGMGRTNYLTNADLADFSRVYRSSGGSSTGINNNSTNNNSMPPISMQMQPQLMNYSQFLGAGGNGTGGSGNSFTISGLNLNLGGGSGGAGGASSSMPPFYRSAAVPQIPPSTMNVQHVDHVSTANSLNSTHDQAAAAAHYGVEMSHGNVGLNNRFMTMEQADLENYWPPY